MVFLLNIVLIGLLTLKTVSAFALFPWLASYVNPNSANTLGAASTSDSFMTTGTALVSNATGSYNVTNSTTYLSGSNGTYPMSNETSVPYLHNWNATLIPSSLLEASSSTLTSDIHTVELKSIQPSSILEVVSQTSGSSGSSGSSPIDSPTDSPTQSPPDGPVTDIDPSVARDITTTIPITYTMTNSDAQIFTTTITAVETLSAAGSVLAAASSGEEIITYLTIVQTITVPDLPEPITTTIEVAETMTNIGTSVSGSASSDDLTTTKSEVVQTLTNSDDELTTTTLEVIETITDVPSSDNSEPALTETLSRNEDQTDTLQLTETRYWNTSSSVDHNLHTSGALSKHHHYTNNTQATYTPTTQVSSDETNCIEFILSSV